MATCSYKMQSLSFILSNISRLPDNYMSQLEEVEETYLREFERSNKKPWLKTIVTGSSVEGLSLDNIIDYPSTFPAEGGEMEEADSDYMVIDGRFVATEIPNRDTDLSRSPLKLELITGKDHHPGYCHLLANKEECIEAVKRGILKTDQGQEYPQYMKEIEDKLYVSSSMYFARAMPYGAESVSKQIDVDKLYTHGPALTGEERVKDPLDAVHLFGEEEKTVELEVMTSFDFVPSIELEQWPLASKNWSNRIRKWPTEELVTNIMTVNCHVVPVAHHCSTNADQEWRISFSLAEKLLAINLTKIQRQIYILVKYHLWKNFINKERILSSYHLKTTFFWVLEENCQSFWTEENSAQLVDLFLNKLLDFLSEHVLPNYFIPTNNMIDHIPKEDTQLLMANIKEAKNDTISCLLKHEAEVTPLLLTDCFFKDAFKTIIPFLKTDGGFQRELQMWFDFEPDLEYAEELEDANDFTEKEKCDLNDTVPNFENADDFEHDEEDDNDMGESLLHESFKRAKRISLVRIARLYQTCESFDYTVQIMKELWHQQNSIDSIPEVDFFTEISLRGADAEKDTIISIIKLHEYLKENVFPDNLEIIKTLAYLNLCFAGVSDEPHQTESLKTAQELLESTKEQEDTALHMLRAKIEAKRGQYREALENMTKVWEFLKESDDVNYIVVNPIEYALMPEELLKIMQKFQDPCSRVTFVPAQVFVLVLRALYHDKLGNPNEISSICKEINKQMQRLDIDDTDKQLSEDLIKFMQHLTKNPKQE